MTVSLQSRAVILLILLGLFPNLALAQKLSFGPIVGLAISTWRGADVRPAPDYRTGFAGGGFLRIGIYRYFGVEADVLYARKGIADTATTCSAPLACQLLTYGYTEDFVEIPLLFTLAGPTRFAPTFFAGPAVAFQTSCTFRTSGPVGTVRCDSVFSGHPGSGGSQPPTPSMKHKDALLVFGGGFHLGPVALQARYDLGVTKFLTRQTTVFDYKTRAWLLTAGYRLSLGRR